MILGVTPADTTYANTLDYAPLQVEWNPGISVVRSIAELNSSYKGEARRIELLQGDLTATPPEHACDVLVVSTFKESYRPSPGTLVAALAHKGVSVEDLAARKSADLLCDFGCWLSEELPPTDGLPFKRLLCFEPAFKGRAPEVVGDIFRALDPFVYTAPFVRSVALPLVATGHQGFAVEEILPPLIDAAWHRLNAGHPLTTIKIVAFSEQDATRAAAVFKAPAAHPPPPPQKQAAAGYDVFVSYSRRDATAARHLAAALIAQGLRVFMDDAEIDVGASWQQRIFDALEETRSTVVLYSPDFLHSKVCKDEFNIAMILRRRRGDDFIHPVLVRDTDLPAYMEILNYDDCRPADHGKLTATAERLAKRLAR